jgi:hypothetical protein
MSAHMSIPYAVKYMKDDIVQSFAFSKTGSAAMVLSRLTGVCFRWKNVSIFYRSD